ncbi:MAG: histidine kinase [Puia sp.]|nr:histidine kinase [Puia sp.]
MKKSIIALLHAAYWLAYLTLIAFFIKLVPGYSRIPATKSLSGMVHILFWSGVTVFAVIPGISGFYSFYSIGFGRFLRQKKIPALALFGISVALITGVLTVATLGFFVIPQLFRNNGPEELMYMTVFLTLLTLIHGILGLVLRGFVVSYGDIQLKEDLNRKNYETELALVKSQVNPHFLFNTIHNIDVLIGIDAEKASAYLNKLSDIMRFMLYETKTEKIELSKELSYIEKYIDLQKIRTANQKYIHYSVEGDPLDWRIEPMLFIPFIENAFKHAENKKIENAIDIRFVIEKDRIVFDCTNSYPDGSSAGADIAVSDMSGSDPDKIISGKTSSGKTVPDQGGIGNELIRRRLSLLYPGKHTLELSQTGGIYRARLTLQKDAH